MQRAQKGSGDAAAGPFPCSGEDRGDAGASSEKNDALLQYLTIRCEVWDKALLREDAASARQIALVEAINKFNRSVDIETVSYADYIGSTLYCELSDTIPGLSPLPAASLANERGNYARSLPVAIENGAGAQISHDDFRCSPSSLSTARSMWVPQVMPPACEVSRSSSFFESSLPSFLNARHGVLRHQIVFGSFSGDNGLVNSDDSRFLS